MRNLTGPVLLGAVCQLVTQTAFCYQTVMIRNTGPASNRVNIVVLGDGYLTSELPQLQADVTAAFSNISNEPFYAEYANFINVKLVLTSSPSNVIGYGSPGATLFGLYFGCEGIDRLICIGDYAQVTDVLDQDASEWDLVAIIANSPSYGGSGGQFVTFTRDTQSTQLFIHETAHQFATLADEYEDAYPAYPPCGVECPEANVTPLASPWQSLKWNYWVTPTTPLPTPGTLQYASTLGAFEGARYQTTGLFRPRFTCRMRETEATFCEVCAEAHVLETYRLVSEFDTVTPSASPVLLAAGASANLSVNHPQTLHNSIQYAWSVDGANVTGTSSSLNLPASSLTVGDHTVRVRLSDTTAFAGRDDPLLHKEQVWQVRVAAPEGTGGGTGIGGASGTGGTLHSAGGTTATSTGGAPAATGGTAGAFGGSTFASTGGNTTAVSGTLATAGAPSSAGGSSGAGGDTSHTGGALPLGGTAPVTSGMNATLAGNAAFMGGSSAADASGGNRSSAGGAPNSSGGAVTLTGGTSASLVSTLSGGASGTVAPGSGGTSIGKGGSSTEQANDRDLRSSCSCSVPGKVGHPALTALYGTLGWLLLRSRKRRREP